MGGFSDGPVATLQAVAGVAATMSEMWRQANGFQGRHDYSIH
jgi:hypothetical protein